MSSRSARAIAHPNIAFIKYWGNRDDFLRLPSNGSISMNLESLCTRTSVTFDPSLESDELMLNGKPANKSALSRTSDFLDIVRNLAGIRLRANVVSENDFPTGAGIASSASAFAALAFASTTALEVKLSESELSRLSRRGSGSACRSVPEGFTEWVAGSSDQDSFARSIAAPSHWQLADCIAVVQTWEKHAGSTEGHKIANTSPVQRARVEDAPRRLEICREAILKKDFEKLADIIELDSNLLHAVMMTSNPPLYYWQGATLEVMRSVRTCRQSGIPCAFTIDAGPNVHVICPTDESERISNLLKDIPGVKTVLISRVGGAVSLLQD
jgi:diphosphomevalonate decarboxylase